MSSVPCCHDYDGQSHTSVGAGLFVCVTGRVERGKVFGMYVTEEWLPCWKYKMKY